MIDYTDANVTVTIDGDERDVHVRAYVAVEAGIGIGGAHGAYLDCDPDLWIGHDAWCPIDSVALGAGDRERIEEALCEAALEERSERAADEREARACAEEDEWDRRRDERNNEEAA